ncbi:MAG: DoxX family protein [Thermoplasmata archaeon]
MERPSDAAKKGFFPKYRQRIALIARIGFGITILVAALNKLLPGASVQYASQIRGEGNGPWFSFWGGLAQAHASAFTYGIAGGEFILAVGLLLGFLRKPTYVFGIAVGLFIWAVPEGLSGFNFSPGLSASAGLLCTIGLILLISVETIDGPDSLSLDYWIIRRRPKWAGIVNFTEISEPIDPPEYMLATMPLMRKTGHGDSSEAHSSARPRRRR